MRVYTCSLQGHCEIRSPSVLQQQEAHSQNSPHAQHRGWVAGKRSEVVIWCSGQRLTCSFGHVAVTSVTITGSAGEIYQFLAALPLLMQLFPHGTIGLDQVNHLLEFRVQFHKRLNGENKTCDQNNNNNSNKKENQYLLVSFCCHIFVF